MQKILVTMMAFALTIAAQAQTETVDTAQFVAVYDYECRTQNDEAASITDRMQLVVQVGRTVTKSMPFSAYPFTDNDSKADVAAGFQEALMHMPTVWTGLPTGQTTVREFIFPHEYEGYEPTPDLAWTLTNDTLNVGAYANNGGKLAPTMMTDDVDFTIGEMITIGKIAKSSPNPAVKTGWCVKRLAIDGDDENEILVAKKGVGFQLIVR